MSSSHLARFSYDCSSVLSFEFVLLFRIVCESPDKIGVYVRYNALVSSIASSIASFELFTSSFASYAASVCYMQGVTPFWFWLAIRLKSKSSRMD